MNFTKDYISLCKNSKVQGLRKELQHGDWVFYFGKPLLMLADNAIQVTSPRAKFKDRKVIWLPQEHDIDREIEKIMESKNNYGEYEFISYGDEYCKRKYKVSALGISCKHFNNPLICKIKLLISLLKEE